MYLVFSHFHLNSLSIFAGRYITRNREKIERKISFFLRDLETEIEKVFYSGIDNIKLIKHL